MFSVRSTAFLVTLLAVAVIALASQAEGSDQADNLTYIHVAGFRQCGYFQRGKRVANAIDKAYSDAAAVIHEFDSRDKYHAFREAQVKLMGGAALNHRTSPLVWLAKQDPDATQWQFIGGASDLIQLAHNSYPQSDFRE